MEKSVAMSMMRRNKAYITFLEGQLVIHKNEKREADEEGRLEDEYFFHEALKTIRAELKTMVKTQKQLKAYIRS